MIATERELLDRLRRYLIVCANYGWPMEWALIATRLERLAERGGVSAYAVAVQREREARQRARRRRSAKEECG